MGRYALKAVYDRMYGQRIVNNACRLHALNELEHSQFLDLDVDPSRISILPNGVDLDVCSELYVQDTDHYLFLMPYTCFQTTSRYACT